MNSFVRVPALVIRQRIRPLRRIGPFDEDRLRLRVWLQDIDFNMHLNNSRYLTFMDYGRMHLLAATGLLDPAMREHWMPLLGSVSITYRRSLALLASFELSTRVLCWDEKWFYMEHVFRTEAGLAAIAWVKGLFRAKEGNIAPQRMVDIVAPGTVSPPVPETLKQWNALTREKLQAGEQEPAGG